MEMAGVSPLVLHVLALIAALAIYLNRLKNNRRRALLAKIPSPRAFPFFGNLFAFLMGGRVETTLKCLINETADNDGIVKLNLFVEDVVVLTKPKYLKVYYTMRSIDKPSTYRGIGEIINDGLFVANGAHWKRWRKLLMLNFFTTPTSTFYPQFVRTSKCLTEDLKLYADGPQFSILHHLELSSFEIIRDNVDFKLSPELQKMVTDYMPFMMEVASLRNFTPLYYFQPVFQLTPIGKEFARMVKETRDHCTRQVQCSLDDIAVKKLKGEDVPNKFVFNMFENAPHEPYDSYTNEVMNLIAAAVDTTAGTMGFILNILGILPEVQEKVYQEDQDILSRVDDGEITYDHLQQYEYLDRVIKETLRLFPVGPIIGRQLTEDTYFGEYLVPAGTHVMAFQLYTNHDADIFPDPFKFDPDRFLPDNLHKIPSYAFNPFSAGPRGCPGNKYAMASIKSIIPSIVRQFRVYSPYKTIEEAIENCVTKLMSKDQNDFVVRLETRKER